MKRLGVDARLYGIAGPGRYISNLLKHLEGKVGYDVFVFLTAKGFSEYQPRDSHFHKVLCDVPWYSWLEQVVLPFLFLRYRLDLVHVPHFNFPVLYPGNLVLTIHDLIINEYSTERATTKFPWYYRFKRLVYRIVVWWGTVRAIKIIVPSNYVKKMLIAVYRASEKKVSVTYEGIDDHYLVDYYKKSYKGDITSDFLLYVGSAYPHKNLERLIKAFKNMKTSAGYNGQLILIGKWDYFSRRLKEETKSESIIFPAEVSPTGYLSDEEIRKYYEGAIAFVFPSLSEGFGLPPLEAMSMGCPVVASDTSSVPEVCGDAALFFDPKEVDDIEKKLIRIISDKGLRESLIKKGLENVKRFSWENMATETLKVYEDCFSAR